MLRNQGREQRTERNMYINNNNNIKLRQSVEGRIAMREVGRSGGREVGIGSFHPRVDLPDSGSSSLSRFPDVYLSFLKPEKKE